jgi:dynein heavy chain 2
MLDSTTQKLELAGSNLIKNVVNQIAASLFKNDRLMFSLHLAKGLKQDLIASSEWEFLLGNVVSIEGRGRKF